MAFCITYKQHTDCLTAVPQWNFHAVITKEKNLEKWAQSDVRKVIVCSIPATLLVRLLPEVQKLLLQLADRTKIEYVVTWNLVIQCRVIHMGQQPRHIQILQYNISNTAISSQFCGNSGCIQNMLLHSTTCTWTRQKLMHIIKWASGQKLTSWSTHSRVIVLGSLSKQSTAPLLTVKLRITTGNRQKKTQTLSLRCTNLWQLEKWLYKNTQTKT